MLMRLVNDPPKPRYTPAPVRSNLTLWQVFTGPPAPRSILVDHDGSVRDVQNPLNTEVSKAAVAIIGGTVFETEKDSFAYTSLVAAGYKFKAV